MPPSADASDRGNRATTQSGRGGLGSPIMTHLGESLRSAFAVADADTLPSGLVTALDRLERALATRGATMPGEAIRDALLTAMPALRRFALTLTHDATRAEDLMQDTLVRAWTKADGFQAGTNLNAWLFTILRNLFYSEQRKRKREVEDADGTLARRLASAPEQEGHVEVRELKAALRHLPATQREALLLIGAQSLTYEEAAEVCGVAVGTMKSRVSRARGRLVELLGTDGAVDLGVGAATLAAVRAA